MKKVVKVLCLAAAFVGMGTAMHAQLHQSIFLNGNIPTAQFGSKAGGSTVPLTYTEIGKNASLGFGLGYRLSYRFDVGVGEVAPFINADFLWNTIGGSWSDKYSDAHYSTPTYFNIPLHAGVTYIYDELPINDVKAYGEFGVGADLFWITSEGGTEKLTNANLKYAYQSTFSFSWMLGAGAFFGEHVSAGLYYYGMGKHNIDYTKGTLDDNPTAAAQVAADELAGVGRQRRTVGSLMLRIGFHF